MTDQMACPVHIVSNFFIFLNHCMKNSTLEEQHVEETPKASNMHEVDKEVPYPFQC